MSGVFHESSTHPHSNHIERQVKEQRGAVGWNHRKAYDGTAAGPAVPTRGTTSLSPLLLPLSSFCSLEQRAREIKRTRILTTRHITYHLQYRNIGHGSVGTEGDSAR